MKKEPILITILLILSVSIVCADAGPKPKTEIIINGINTDSEIYANLIAPEEIGSNNEEKSPLNEPFGSTKCVNNLCNFIRAVPSPFIVEIYLPETNHRMYTNLVKREHFDSVFEINVDTSKNTATITDITPFFKYDKIKPFLFALPVTILLECLVAIMYVKLKKAKKNLVSIVAYVNLITVPFVWFLFPLIPAPAIVIPLAEAFAFFFEAEFIFEFMNRKMKRKRCYLFSLIANATSFVMGGFSLLLFMLLC